MIAGRSVADLAISFYHGGWRPLLGWSAVAGVSWGMVAPSLGLAAPDPVYVQMAMAGGAAAVAARTVEKFRGVEGGGVQARAADSFGPKVLDPEDLFPPRDMDPPRGRKVPVDELG